MGVVHEADPVHVDHPQVWRRALQRPDFEKLVFSLLFVFFSPDVEHLVDLPLLLLTLLIGPVKVEHLDAVDEVVDLLHEVVEEYRLAETHAQVLDLGNKFGIK